MIVTFCLRLFLLSAVAGAGVLGAEPSGTFVHVELDELKSLIGSARYADAEQGARALLTSVSTAKGEESLEAAQVLDVLVEALWRGGKAGEPEARTLAERAVFLKERAVGHEDPEVANSLSNLGSILYLLGSYKEARAAHERALSIREKQLGPEHPDVARSLGSLGVLLRSIGSYSEAKSLMERGLAILEKNLGPDHPDLAQGLQNLAVLMMETGSYDEAKSLFERALSIREKHLGPDHPDVARTLSNLGSLLRVMGEYSEAKSLLERGLAILERSLGPDHPDVARGLTNLAALLEEFGATAEAKPLLVQALSIREKRLGPNHPDVASSLYNLARVSAAMGAYAEAKPLYQRSVAIYEAQLGPDHPDLAIVLRNFGALLEKAGAYAEARLLFERSLAIRERVLGTDHPYTSISLVSLGHLLAITGEKAPALTMAMEAERIGREHLRLTARTLGERQALSYASVRASGLDLALSLAADGLGSVSDLGPKVWDCLIRSRALVLDEMATRHRAVAETGDSESLRLVQQLATAQRRLANLMLRGPGREPTAQYRTNLQEAVLERETVEGLLAERSTRFRHEQAKSRVGFDEVVKSLPARTSLLAYIRYHRITKPPDTAPQAGTAAPRAGGNVSGQSHDDKDDRHYLALILRSGDAQPRFIPLGSAWIIDSLIMRWQSEVASAPSGMRAARKRAETRYRTAGERLRKVIWDPLLEGIKGSQQVFIVPDGALNLVSLATLPVEGGRYLIETGPLLHYLSAERDLAPTEEPIVSGQGVLIVGGPDFDRRARQPREANAVTVAYPDSTEDPSREAGPDSFRSSLGWCMQSHAMRFEPLPGALAEAEEIQSLWFQRATDTRTGEAGVVLLTGSEAGEAAFKKAAPGRRIVHLATHAFLAEESCHSSLNTPRKTTPEFGALPEVVPGENPLVLAGLALAGANLRESGGDLEDGILTAEEIASLDLRGLEWAVLSACGTGLGQIQAGEGVLGLRRAFQIAGAGTLIMSLWQVDDEATIEWMRRLYQARNLGRSTAESMRAAGVETLDAQRRTAGTTHPFAWGSFVAAGDWR